MRSEDTQIVMLRMLMQRGFFVRAASLIDEAYLDCIEYRVILRAINRVFTNLEGPKVSFKDLKLALKDMGVDLSNYSSILRRMKRVKKDAFRASLVSEFLQKTALKSIAKEIIETIESNEMPDVDEISGALEKVRYSRSNSHQVMVNYEFEEYTAFDEFVVKLGIDDELDEIISVGHGELGVIMAAPETGKTTMMVNLARFAMKRGLHVVYVTADEPKERIIRRMDQSITKSTGRELRRHPARSELAKDVIKDWKARLSILDLTYKKTSVAGVGSLLDDLVSGHLTPDFLIVDYPDRLVSPGFNENRVLMMEIIYTDLAMLGRKLECPVWVGSQVTSESYGYGRITLASAKWSRSKSENATSVVALMRNDEMDGRGLFTLRILKSRNAKERPDVVMGANWSTQRIWYPKAWQ